MEVIGRGSITVVDGSKSETDAWEIHGHRPLMISGVVLHSLPAGYRFDLRRRERVATPTLHALPGGEAAFELSSRRSSAGCARPLGRERDGLVLEEREVDRASLAPRREHRVHAVDRGGGRDRDIKARCPSGRGKASSIPSRPRASAEQRATAVMSSIATSNCGARVSWMNATPHPARAPSRYAVGLGARFSPPSAAGRSASQLNGPVDRRARPLASVAVTVGVERAVDGSLRNRVSVSARAVADMCVTSGPATSGGLS
jgi:hypothetical protein